MPHRTVKIVATLGPASSEPEILEQLIQAGVNVFRFNYAHGTREGHATVIKQVHDLAMKLNKPVGTLADISGPKIRLGKIPGDTVSLTEGMLVSLCSPEVEQIGLPVQLSNFAEHVQQGDPIYLSDGTRKLIVAEIKEGIVKAVVATGGDVTSHKGINLPFLRKNLPPVSAKDLQDIDSALKAGIDWIGLSFVSSSEDLIPIHSLMKEMNLWRPVLAKLERRQALDHLDEIVQAFDGVMVARGDLGIEVEFEKVPVIQDRILRTAHRYGKPAIVATQILTSMVSNPRPTRAEVTDIAYAVKSGADALMLSEETAIGAYPVGVVRIIVKVAQEIEASSERSQSSDDTEFDQSRALARTAVILAQNTRAAAILCPTHSGNAARSVAQFQPRVPIIVVSDVEELIGELTLYRGIYPQFRPLGDTLDSRIETAVTFAEELGLAEKGDKLVIVGGVPAGSGHMNLLMVHEVE